LRHLAASVFAASAILWAAPAAAQTFVDAQKHGLITVLGQPPSPDSHAQQADLEAVLSSQMQRSDIEAYAAQLDGGLSALQWAQAVLGKDYAPEKHPEAFALFEVVRADISKTLDVVKDKGPQRKRPHQQDARVKPSLSVQAHETNSWPSARSAASRVWAGVLSDLFPNKKIELAAAAERTAALRLIGGVHYPSDIAAGKRLADAFLIKLREHPEYQARLKRIRPDEHTQTHRKSATLKVISPSHQGLKNEIFK
jgi:acid phosphatase (class A)